MTEAPLLNDAAARSPTGEILDQSQTQALEAQRQATESARIAAEPKPDPATNSTDPTPKPQSDTSTTKQSGSDGTLADPAAPTESKAAPESYEAFKLPEGFTLAPETVAKITPVLKELGLSQEGAQRLVDFHSAELLAITKSQESAISTLSKEWQAKTLADPEIQAYSLNGKTGIDAVKVDLGRALAVLPADLRAEFSRTMNETGIGNNPAFVRAFWKMAQHITEGKYVSGRGPSPLGQVDPTKPAKTTGAHAMYPTLPSAAG